MHLSRGSCYAIIDEEDNIAWGCCNFLDLWCISDYWRTEFAVDKFNGIIVFERRKSLTWKRQYLYVQEKDLVNDNRT